MRERRGEAIAKAQEIFPELENPAGFAEAVHRLADADAIEVQLPKFVSEEKDWALRIFPWEFFLSAITREERKRRGSEAFLVTRVLPVAGRTVAKASRERMLTVESAPPPLDQYLELGPEADLVLRNMGVHQEPTSRLANPSAEELRLRIAGTNPGVIHLGGFDTRKAAQKAGDFSVETIDRHAYLLSGEGRMELADAEGLGGIVNAGSPKPELVSFNLFNSAARMCPMAVAGGAGAAIGFQDEIDDHLAEVFFASFYRAWTGLAQGNLLAAFAYAFEKTRELPKSLRMRGSGIVLWSATPLLDQGDGHTERPMLELSTAREEGDELDVHVTPVSRLNYAILHNRGHLFDSFKVTRAGTQSPEDVLVEVKVRIGVHEYPYRAVHDAGQEGVPKELKSEIQIPLSWNYLSTLTETVRTTVYVRISQPGENPDRQVYLEKTYSVDLAPLEEWTDREPDHVWLPSFIRPRDPAVATALGNARLHLCTLTDDPTAGFDGYQSYNADPNEPGFGVETQVRAIWSALLLHHDLQYVNPPPSYFHHAQRLRSPSELLGQEHGTCIDLSLLVASCLEYIEIQPVVFLIEGHAFPGFWRNPHQAKFFRDGLLPDGEPNGSGPDQEGSRHSWVYSRSQLRRIWEFVAAGHLVPLESTLLTRQGGFFAACESGIEALRNPDTFQYLLDVDRSRTDPEGATPLPINYSTSLSLKK